jgi:PAS domain S-box-containing protein
MHGLALKEELILFPAACDVIEEEEWNEMERQSMAYSFPFIQRPAAPVNGGNHRAHSLDTLYLRSETGTISLEQVQMIFDALPVDLSFVDEENKVRFFTRSKDRIFPRSPAVIGRDVKNCHPPESVGVVLEIIEAFRSGRQDSATFWIQRKDRMILIQYFAVRESAGTYRGTLEVSQDITNARQLTGERRLLQWDS